MLKVNVLRSLACLLFRLSPAYLVFLSCPAVAQNKPSGSPSALKREMTALEPDATFNLGGDPDWMAVADDAVWVSTSSLNRVTELKAPTNTVGFSVAVKDPCSGLVAAFGSVWIPSCGGDSLLRANLKTGKVEATITAAPADSEGCIAAGAESIWLATDKKGTLARIDPKSNSVRATIEVPSGSYCPVFADDFIWVTSFEHSVLSKVDPGTNRVVAQIPVGKNPRFATSGAGAVWSLNQGDGTVSRVDTRTSKVVATIPAGLAGHGGEITFGFGSVWATLIGIPVTRIDAASNLLVRQWQGDGGDSIRAGLGTVWLTDLKAGLVWRISPDKL
jgi:virginiamycin B lyase